MVYGRCKTYNHLGEAAYIKEGHNCDCLKASLSGMMRTNSEENEIRKGLACSKVTTVTLNPAFPMRLSLYVPWFCEFVRSCRVSYQRSEGGAIVWVHAYV